MARNYFVINRQAVPGRCPVCGKSDSGVFTEKAAEAYEVFEGTCPSCSTHMARAIDDHMDGCCTLAGALEKEFPAMRAERATEFLKSYYQQREE